MHSKRVIKCVAGSGKTTDSIKFMQSNKNGLYLAFNNKVVNEISNAGYLGLTIDSLFFSYVLPKMLTFIPLAANCKGVVLNQEATRESIQKKNARNIKFNPDGTIKNQTSVVNATLNDTVASIATRNFPNRDALKYIFDNELHVTYDQAGALGGFLINKYPEQILWILRSRFDYIIIDEAQDLKPGFREDFAKLLYDNDFPVRLLGDSNQNINGGGNWFNQLNSNEENLRSCRCPEGVCEWIRQVVGIEIYGKDSDGIVCRVTTDTVKDLDNSTRTLLYAKRTSGYAEYIDNWSGEVYTIKKAKGLTIKQDIVILANDLKTNNLYTAMTRTTSNVYMTVTKLNGRTIRCD